METINDNISIEVLDLSTGNPILTDKCKFIKLDLFYALNSIPTARLYLSAPDSLQFGLLNDVQIKLLLVGRFRRTLVCGIIKREIKDGTIILDMHMFRRAEFNVPGTSYLGSSLINSINALNITQKPDDYFTANVKIYGDFWRMNETVESILQKMLYGAKSRTPWLITEDQIRLIEFDSSDIIEATPADYSSSFIMIDGKEDNRISGSKVKYFETASFDSTNLSFRSNNSYYKNVLSNLLFNDPMYLSIVQNYGDYIPYSPGDRMRVRVQTLNKIMNIIACEYEITTSIKTKLNLGVLKNA